jgi:hypothetical protein
MQVVCIIQGLPRPRPNCLARVLDDQVDAQPSDNSFRVVLIQAVKGQAVVEQCRRLKEHFLGDREVNVRSGWGDGNGGRHELIEGRARWNL